MGSMKTRLGAVLAVLTIVVGAGAGSALAQSEAYGLSGSVTGLASVAPTPLATNPPGQTSTGLMASGLGVTANVTEVSSNTVAGTGQVSIAQLANVAIAESITIPGTAAVLALTGGATTVRAECTFATDAAGATGDITLAGLTLAGTLAADNVILLDTVPADPGPDTVVRIGIPATNLTPEIVIGTITLNERISLAGSGLRVNAIHIRLGGGTTGLAQLADIIIGSASCTSDGSVNLAVTLRSLTASPSKSGVVVRWRTASELGLVGYNVYRERAGKRVRVNKRLIAARSTSGGSYVFVDRSARSGRYWLQAVNIDGSRSFLASARLAR